MLSHGFHEEKDRCTISCVADVVQVTLYSVLLLDYGFYEEKDHSTISCVADVV